MHKSKKELTLTYEVAFEWSFEYHIEIMERLAENIGRGKLIERIQLAVDNRTQVGGKEILTMRSRSILGRERMHTKT
jgi:hypothetical protein